MALTKFDSNFYRGEAVPASMSSFVAFNIGLVPGKLFMAGSSAVQNSVGSKIAARICLDRLANSVLDCYALEQKSDKENILESSFKRANQAVYQFGHQLSAGGRLAAAVIALAVEDRTIIAGRVGAMGAYLYRKGRLFPFFISNESADTCIGINDRVTVETAEVEIKPFDSIFIFSRMLSVEQEQQLLKFLGGIEGRLDFDLDAIVKNVFYNFKELSFAQVLSVGPETIFL